MGIIKGFTFDGVDSLDYNIGITGSAVYNAPTRDVEMISIPGRDGEYALDHGRFNNIEITYPAGMYDTAQTDFATRISELRNQLASRVGYKRLEDEYNPDEYRMAIYKSGLEVSPVQYSRAGQFDIIFDCKPQRFLSSGEEVFTLGEWGQTETKSGSIVSFEGDETTAIKSLTAQIVPKQSGSGDPSPSNVRPISGYTDVNVNVCGINVWDEEWEVGNIDSQGNNSDASNRIRSKNYVPVIPNTQYYIKSPSGLYMWGYDSNKTYIGRVPSGTLVNGVITIPNNCYYIRFIPDYPSYGTTYNNDISINYPATDTSYHIGASNESYPISLGQTVYGGTLEVMSGKLTIKKVAVDLGSLNWGYNPPSGHELFNTLTPLSGAKLPTTPTANNIICSAYVPVQYGNIYNHTKAFSICLHTNGYVYIYDSRYTDATALKTALNGVYLVYELATPTEIQLTPTEVQTLLGQNNIWADSGDVTVEIGQNPYILVNPTLFEACPLIEFNSSGNGTITINGQTIELLNAPYGIVEVPYTILKTNVSDSIATNTTYYNTGDSFTVTGAKITYTFTMASPITSGTFPSGLDLAYVPYESSISGSRRVLTVEDYQVSDFVAGTSKTVTKTATFTTTAGGTTYTNTITLTLNYSGAGGLSVSWAITNNGISSLERKDRNYDKFVIVADSTAYSLRGDIYIDLDIGEAYTDYNNTIMSVNNFVNLGGELPTLPPGNTTITYSNTISNFKITPRWWKI